MNRAPLVLACLLLTAWCARAQQQEPALLSRIDSETLRAMKAMDVHSKGDPALTNPMQKMSFDTSSVGTKTFSTSQFTGVKEAGVKTFETRSFLGIKNPWFGGKVYDTYATQLANQTAHESSEQYKTQAYEVRDFEKGHKDDMRDASTEVPADTQPHQYLIPAKRQGALDRFTENLHKDLTIDDVRDLLNKGKGEGQ
ncbi:MAG TPA: hypothetical protein VIM48_01100 [Chthoniobacterales bacterium]